MPHPSVESIEAELITGLTAFPARTTSSAATATSAKASTATAAAAASAFLAWARFVDFNFPAMQGLVCQAAYRGLGALIGGHRYKRESARPAAHAVGNQIHFRHRPKFLKQVLQIIFRGVEGKVSYEQFIAHVMYLTRLYAHSLAVPGCRVSIIH